VSLVEVCTVIGVLIGFVLFADVRAPSGRSDPSAVSVIIPARNEEVSLPNLLGSLAAQTVRPCEVIVVDDGSTDGTPAAAVEGGATLLRAPALPETWVGKPWACHTGSLHARGETFVFLDADVELAPDGLDRLLASWQRDASGGLLSVQPFHTTHRAYEQLSAYPNLMSVMASGAFAPKRWRSSPVAFGPCLVTSAEAYRAVGGHEVVAGEIIEDIHLARVYGACGLPVRVLAGGSAVTFRMYPSGLRQLVDGWTKNLAGGPQLVGAWPLLAAIAWLLASIVVASDLVGALVTGITTGRIDGWPIAAWAVVALQTAWFLRRIGRFRWWAAPAFPILLAGFVAVFLRSAVHRALKRTVVWHDRTIAVRAR